MRVSSTESESSRIPRRWESAVGVRKEVQRYARGAIATSTQHYSRLAMYI